ncbi:LysE family transporter [Clostridium sp. 19966]|uniref:LysE family translocator n=1 Tax=Clostridium sp. 19966 TaxID=2768166 RepID=UPI0028DFFBF1|nr:LysE family transporter [Clostridium sp. 19966]MDT8715694.1 LysE family transporter [Clostridium sp. 19966]
MVNYILLFRALIIGLVTGIIIAIPIGPSGIESVRWTISKGFKKGIWVAVGSVIADTFDVVLINFGLLNWIKTNKTLEIIFWIVSGAVTFFIGIRAIMESKKVLKEPKETEVSDKVKSLPLFTGFIINITYPMTHLSWLAFSTTFIAVWRHISFGAYVTFVVSMLSGIMICLTMINILASKGKKVAKQSNSSKFADLLAYGIAILGIIFFTYGIFKLVTLRSYINL